ncbi:beta-N-acetylhexosaminidase [Streptoalloteichus hindustanus]|uniref:beta-N-acetylhexosaminidase n=1 Tax=Streptoalloteichus hindustanus TaxID=2017 RepID=A0A1M4WBG0_STRHI|nr:beta-N-acetylhexosaminidase [Streptoalloteichus hindustanus]SHE78500.1 hexosaminidase [Streptoalloteichus hindustanus]
MTSFDCLVPQPVTVTPAEGAFVLDSRTTLVADPGAEAAARWLRRVLGAAAGLALPPSTVDTAAAGIELRIDPDAAPGPEGYRLEITPAAVRVVAADASGAFYAAQTLRQLLGADAFRAANVHSGEWSLPCGVVVDRPRFGWRGCLLDVARHFMPKDALLRFVDLLAAHKLNVLHLHLTDDQGWRMEIKRYPRLTEVGAWRHGSRVGWRLDDSHDGRPHGGYYTQADLREVVAYAAERGITVVPEVDVPGHVQAALAAYPELGNTGERLDVWPLWGVNENILSPSDAAVKFFQNVFDEVVDVFPSPVVCVGGDEVPMVQWERSPDVRRRMGELGLSEVAELHSWFLRQMAERLADHGRRALGWDEMAEGEMPEGVIVASWRGEEAGVLAAARGHDVVMCPEQHVYLDHRQAEHPDEPVPVGFLSTLQDFYRYDPLPADLDPATEHRVLGAQTQVWTEHLDSPRRVDYAAFPRLVAFAEVVWSPRQARDLADFERRLAEHHLPRLDALGVEYRPLTGPRPWQTRPGVPGRPRARVQPSSGTSSQQTR